MRRHLGVGVLLLAGCTAPESTFRQQPPDFGRINLPDLTGEVVVRDSTQEVIARATLVIDGAFADAALPSFPAGAELSVQVLWSAGGFVVAASRPVTVLIAAGGTVDVTVGLSDYTYPDDDGDGAINLFEVAFAATSPTAGSGAAGNAALAPPGYFNQLVRALPLPGRGSAVAVRDSAYQVLVAAQEFDGDDFINHTLSLVDLQDGTRSYVTYTCDDVASSVVLGSLELTGAVACGGINRTLIAQVNTITLGTSVPVGDGANLVYSKSEELLYAVGPDTIVPITSSGSLSIIPTHEDFEPIVVPVSAVDSGEYVFVTEAGVGIVSAYNHLDDVILGSEPWVVEGLSAPGSLVLHPNGHRLYVAEGSEVLVVDVADLDDFVVDRVVERISAGEAPIQLAIDRSHGYWLYAASHDRLQRINTLTNAVEWELRAGEGLLTGFLDIDVSPSGNAAALVSLEDALYELGFSARAVTEVEPASTVASAQPVIDTVVGWLDPREETSFELPWTTTDTALDDVEDFWSPPVVPAGKQLVVALTPTRLAAPIKLLLLDDDDDVVAQALDPNEQERPVGSGLLLFSNVVTAPTQFTVALAARDTALASVPYELWVRAITPPTVVQEMEPNDDHTNAQVLPLFQAVIEGSLDPSDAGTYLDAEGDDYEDCFEVDSDGTRLAVRLDFPSDADLDLAVLTDTFAPYPRQHAEVGEGIAEMLITEPRANGTLIFCVGADDSTPAPVDYTLTFVDLLQ